MSRLSRSFGFAVAFAALLAIARAESNNDEVLPKKVWDATKAKFPKAELLRWTKDRDAGKVVYNVEFKQGARELDADIDEAGTVLSWEKEIEAKELPKAVRDAVSKKYPKATLTEIYEVYEVVDGKDKLEEYEIVLETVHKQEIELTVSPDGKILEDSAYEKKDEKKGEKK